MPVATRAPSMKTSYPLGIAAVRSTRLTCMLRTMHWRPNSFEPALTSAGLRTAIESMLIFSAPAPSTACMSSRSRTPPPTVSGTKMFSATARTVSRSARRRSGLAVMS